MKIGKDGALGSLIKQLTEAALVTEIDSPLTQDLNRNRKNGYATKTMKSEHGEFELDVPRVESSSFRRGIPFNIFRYHPLQSKRGRSLYLKSILYSTWCRY